MSVPAASASSNPLIRKLASAERLSDGDRAVLEGLCRRTRRCEAGRDVIRIGDPPSDVHVVLDGFAYRYKLMPEGKRQIVAVLVPGDFCDLHVAILGEMDHSIATLTPCTFAEMSAATIRELTHHHPHITRALWWATLVDEGTLREWLASLGQRNALKRMAHFFCEMLVRLQTVELADGSGYDLPLTQADLADLLGITSIHVNRTLQELRASKLVSWTRRRVTLHDVGRLKRLCDFDPIYLHLHGAAGTPDRWVASGPE